MARTTLAQYATRTDARLEGIEAGIAQLLAAQGITADAPARTRKAAKPAKDEGFVTWLRESAPQRAARKASNAEMAAWLRSQGLNPAGAVWEAAKQGERSLKVLRKLV